MKSILTAQDVAHLLAVDQITVYRLARKGQLPGFKVGNQWRFDRGVLEQWMAHQVHRPASTPQASPQTDERP